MDHRMPVMDGFEATRRIRALERTGCGLSRSLPCRQMPLQMKYSVAKRPEWTAILPSRSIRDHVSQDCGFFSEKSKGRKFCKRQAAAGVINWNGFYQLKGREKMRKCAKRLLSVLLVALPLIMSVSSGLCLLRFCFSGYAVRQYYVVSAEDMADTVAAVINGTAHNSSGCGIWRYQVYRTRDL